MIGLISSKGDPASKNISDHIIKEYGLRQIDSERYEVWKDEKFLLYRIDAPLIGFDEADRLNLDVAYFLSKHKSEKGVAAFTVHSLGNWTKEAKIGGKPLELSFAAPCEMLSTLRQIAKIDASDIEKTYEATHHGPLLKTPSFFVELGGGEDAIADVPLAAKLGDAVIKGLSESAEYSKIAIGIGDTHYPSKFTRLALEKGYAFSHIMPKYAINTDMQGDNLGLIGQTLERSSRRPEVAIIVWKSINSNARNKVVKALGEIGLDYEKA